MLLGWKQVYGSLIRRKERKMLLSYVYVVVRVISLVFDHSEKMIVARGGKGEEILRLLQQAHLNTFCSEAARSQSVAEPPPDQAVGTHSGRGHPLTQAVTGRISDSADYET